MSKSELDIQVDFTGGQINKAALRRNDLPAYKMGGEVVQNWRALATGQLIQRPGRAVVYNTDCRRGEYFRVSTGEEFMLRFGDGRVEIYDLVGNFISGQNLPERLLWRDNTVNLINWTQANDNIIICYRGPDGTTMQPYCVFWNRTTRSWTYGDFEFERSQGIIKQPFYRRSSLGVVLSYDKTEGTATVTAANVQDGEVVFAENMVGQYLSIVGQQCKITKYIDARHVEVQIVQRLPDSIAIFVKDARNFYPGQICSSTSSSVKMEVGSVDIEKNIVIGIMTNQLTFNVDLYPTSVKDTDFLVGPNGQSTITNIPAYADPGSPTLQWAETFMSPISGFPASVSYDRGRLTFTNFQQAQNAIIWSQVGSPFGFWVDSVAAKLNPGAGANDDSAIFSLIAGCPQIYYMVGWQQGQFIFTYRGVYFIPISAQSPLKPGALFFEKIADDGISNIRPITLQDAILFVNQGLNRVGAIRATGSITRPFLSIDVADLHYDLFDGPVFLAATTGDGERPERYVYVVNSTGNCIVGKAAFGGDGQPMFIGWAPWESFGNVRWVATKGSEVYYTTEYPGHTGSFYNVEVESARLFFDYGLLVYGDNGNANPPPGYGPFYKLPPGTMISLVDGNIDFGERPIDEKGFIVTSPNEDLRRPNLVGGLFTPCVFQPYTYFDRVGDRTKRISVNRIYVNVQDATDFTLENKVFSTNRWGENTYAQPLLLNGAYRIRTIGRGWKQTTQLVKHRPGPITLCELTIEVGN